ncbi:MAG: hypothetical protein A2096_15745 [Spirochaetes bacterium GWF1_41_5]|nr:MAG: hypothetical protein A2096_15745 [Spirochaetes bacterium GWF1_41_5]HBE03590.1 hypothetical protein [Spirochaetia bacterium]
MANICRIAFFFLFLISGLRSQTGLQLETRKYPALQQTLYRQSAAPTMSPLRRAEVVFFISLAFTISYSYAAGKLLEVISDYKKIETPAGVGINVFFISANSALWSSCIAVNDYNSRHSSDKAELRLPLIRHSF